MSRVQLALNVSDIDEAVDFYSKLFATEPAKRRPGYANFAVAEPPLKLVLIEDAGQPAARSTTSASRSTTTDEVTAANARLDRRGPRHRHRGRGHLLLRRAGQGLGRRPRRRAWEIYTVLADAEHRPASSARSSPAPTPCAALGAPSRAARCC